MFLTFKNDVLFNLKDDFTPLQLQLIDIALIKASSGYSFSKQTTDITVVGRDQMIDLLKLYIVVKKTEGLSDKTLKLNMIILKKFIYNCTVPLLKVTANMIRAWLYNYQLTNNISVRTMDLYRILVCTFIKWCYTEGYIDKDITINIGKIKYQRNQRHALTQLLLENVRHACKTDRLKCIIETLYSTGCRVSLIINIKLSDINWNDKSILVTGKGNKQRLVYINAKAEYAIKLYLKNRKHNSEYLITGLRKDDKISTLSIQRMFTILADRCGMSHHDLSPHIMRHTMATQAVKLCPIEQVQKMLGHSSINTTMIYTLTNQDSIKSSHLLAII